MNSKSNIHAVQGLWCAMLTPIAPDGGVDHGRFVRHAQALLARGVDGVAPFGTTGEGVSFSVKERSDGVAALLAGGISPQRVVAATGCAALTETIALTRESVQAGCAGCLVLPPYFFNAMSDDGLYAWYARVIEAVADPRLRVLLYHIPQFSGIPLSVDLVARLADAFPGVIAGVKDSGGDWSYTSALLERVPELGILVGHEPHVPRLLREGGAGTICGVANVFPEMVRALFSPSVTPADEERIATFISILFEYPFLSAFKAIVAAQTADPGWRALRPPWIELPEAAQQRFLGALERAGMRVRPSRAV